MIESQIQTQIASTTKSESAFRTISEVAEELGVQQHVLRFWETKFTQVKPLKRGGGRRYYRPEDVALLKKIHTLLYAEGYTIKGVQKLLRGVSKSQVLAEQKAEQSSKAYGENLPKVEGPDKASTNQQEVSTTQSNEPVISRDEYVDILSHVLSELVDMKSQLSTLLSDDQDEQAA